MNPRVFAVVSLDENISLRFRAPEFISTFTLEAMAIREALRISVENESKRATIFSDSKSVLTAIKNFPQGDKTSMLLYFIKDEIKMLLEKGIKIKPIWIPSHCGIIGNELADARAKAAIKNGNPFKARISLKDFKNLFKEELFLKFFSLCEETDKEKGKFYFQNYFVKNRDT